MSVSIAAKAALEDQLEELKALVGQDGGPDAHLLDLPKYPGRLLALLMKRPMVTREQGYIAIYYDRAPDDRPDPKTIDIYLSKPLRPRLKELGASIHTRQGVGWYIDDQDKARIRAAIEEIKMTGKKPRPVEEDEPEEFILEDDIPIPPIKGKSKYPLADMKVGQSFFVKAKKAASLHRTVDGWKKANKSEFKFTIRKVPGGTRIWRIE